METKNQRINNFEKYLDDTELNIIYDISLSLENNKYDCKQLLEDILISDDYNNWISIESNQKAIAAKIKRYYYSTKQLNNGYYKNYKLFKSIKNPSKIEGFKNKIPDDVYKKYQLNEKQELAVQKAINANDLFYLQGPPGTGKTQTLCAITESIICKNKNVAMCSSNHEAIDNFLERLFSFNKNNPNLIIFKYRFNDFNNKKEHKSQFSQDTLYSNFKNSIYSFVINNEDVIKENCKKYINKYAFSKPNFLQNIKRIKLPISYLKIIQNNLDYFNNNLNLLQYMGEWVSPFNSFFTGNESSINYDNINEAIKIVEITYKNLKNNDKDEYDKTILFDKAISELLIDNLNFDFLTENIIQRFYSTNKKKNNIQDKFIKIQNKFSLSNKDRLETKFLDYIMENNLINVIRMTTSSRQSIEINGIKKNLFSNYSIDTMLIDEISNIKLPKWIPINKKPEISPWSSL